MFALCTAVTVLRLFARAKSNANFAILSEAGRVISFMLWTTPSTTCKK